MAVFWFKNPELRMFFIMVVIVVPIYALNIHDGIRAMPKEWLEMCESFRPSRLAGAALSDPAAHRALRADDHQIDSRATRRAC